MVDSGAMVNLMTQECATKLGLAKPKPTRTVIHGLTGNEAANTGVLPNLKFILG